MITYILLGLTILVSYLALHNSRIVDQYVHYPYLENRDSQYYRLLTSGFLHGSYNHLFINMFVLWQFGSQIENYYFRSRFGSTRGIIYFTLFYFLAVIVSNIGTHLRHRNNPNFRSLGASGVTSSLVLIYSLLAPWQMFVFPPVPAIVFAVLYLAYSQWAVHNRSDHIDHMGHLWGALFGLGFIAIVDPELYLIFYEKIKDIPFLN